MKTKETLQLEKALETKSKERREYGCEEVTIGFKKDKLGDEIVDYMTMDACDVFKCYEIKVTLSDLKSNAKKSWYGDFNYLVVSNNLYARNPIFDNYIPSYVGILVGEDLTVKRKAKKKDISIEQKNMLKDSLLRSVFWKMDNYRDADNLENYRNLKKELEVIKQEYNDFKISNDRKLWTYDDYENWYQKNHQNKEFKIAIQAKEERRQYSLRKDNKFNWIKKGDSYICPICNDEFKQNTNYCPNCGTDLRRLK